MLAAGRKNYSARIKKRFHTTTVATVARANRGRSLSKNPIPNCDHIRCQFSLIKQGKNKTLVK